MPLELLLFGPYEARRDGQAISFPTERARALLAYLAMNPDHPQLRQTLAELFWYERSEEAARNSLRTELNRLRQAIDDVNAADPLLVGTRLHIEFVTSAEATVDVHQFKDLLRACRQHSHLKLSSCPPCAERLQTAVALYRGDFLAEIGSVTSPPFEDWLRATQETLRAEALWALEILIEHFNGRGEFERVLHYAQRQLKIQPWREPAHRHIMRALTLQGQRAAALRQYEICRSVLAAELAADPSAETTALYEQIRAGERSMPAPETQNPYQGLRPFEMIHASFFFGRESTIERLLEAVQRKFLVTLIGASGSGKTSLIQAGLLPRLTAVLPQHPVSNDQREATKSAAHVSAAADGLPGWLAVTMRPGEDPFQALADALRSLLPLDQPSQDWASMLRSGEQDLLDLADGLGAIQKRLLLIIDQFEELFTLATPADRQPFLKLLLSVFNQTADAMCVSTLIVVRADFMAQVLASAPLTAALQEAAIVLGPMNRQEIRRAIEQPALRQGVIFEPGLVERLLDDVGVEPGNLPLLEFALTRLWQEQKDGWLTHAAYEEIERVVGALTHYADGIYARLAPQEQQGARRIFLQLVQPGQGTEDIRRTATRAEIDEEDWPLVQRMADARLVITNQNANGDETVELVHEALIREWRRLQTWLGEDREFRLWQQRVRMNLSQWQLSQQDEGALLRGGPLAEAEHWMSQRNADLDDPLIDYIQVSLDYRRRRQLEREAQRLHELTQAQALAQAEHERAETEAKAGARLRRLVLGTAVALIMALIAAAFAFQSRQEAEHERARAESNAQLALARQLGAQAIRAMENEIDLALLLSLEATRLELPPSNEASLLTELVVSPLLEKVLHGPPSPIFSLTFSEDGRTLFSTDDKGNVLVWPIFEAGTPPSILVEQDGENAGIALSPKGDRMAVNRSHSVTLWDLNSRQIIATLTHHASDIIDIAFSHDGETLISVDKSNVLLVQDADTGEVIRPPLTSDGNQPISADGETFVQLYEEGERQSIWIWDSETDERKGSLEESHSAAIHGFDFSKDKRRVATASFDGSIRLWDVSTGKVQGDALHGHDGRVLIVSFSPDDRTLVSGGTDNRLLLWDLSDTPRISARLNGHNNWIRGLAFSADGKWLASADADGKIILWRMGRQILRGHTDRVRTVALSPDSQTLVTASFDGHLGVWDAPAARLQEKIATPHERTIINAGFSPDGATFVTVNAGGGVLFWDTRSWEPRYPLRQIHDSVLIGLAFSADGQWMATGDFTGFIRIWDVNTGEPAGPAIKAHEGWALSLAFSPDGKTLASGSTDASLKLWDLSTRQMQGEALVGHTNWITDLIFTPDGETLISASADHTIRIWDVDSGEVVGDPLVGHEGQVWAVQFHPPETDQMLVSLGGDGALLRWDWRTGQPLGPPLRADIETESMALSPDGSYLYLGTFDATAQRWELIWAPWQERACHIANRNLTLDEWRTHLYDLPYEKSCADLP